MIKDCNVLVTGGAGFIGSHIVNRLSPNNKVTVLDNLSSGLLSNLKNSEKRINFIEGDIRDKGIIETIVRDMDYVFHLAANVGNIKSIEDPYIDMDVNIKGTINLLESCVNSNIKKLVYSASAAVYGDAQIQPTDEKYPPDPESPYAVSKLAAEKYCSAFHKIYGLPVISLRYFNVYGPRQGSSEYANVIPVFFRRIRANEPITIFGDGEQTRDFVNVKDVVNANILAAESELNVGLFNIASCTSTTINELADHIINITNQNIERIYSPIRKGEVLHSLADISAAKKMLGYNPSVNIIDGLKEYSEY